MKPVAVTGIGAVSPFGTGAGPFLEALREGRSGLRRLDDYPGEVIGGRAEGFDPARHFTPKERSRMDRISEMVLVAADEAMAAAGLDEAERADRDGLVILGTIIGGEPSHETIIRRYYTEDMPRIHPFGIATTMPSGAASHVSMRFRVTGGGFCVSSACASATHAIGTAAREIALGEADYAITGGVEAMLTPSALRAWEGMRILAPDACRPFSVDRKGMVLSEGAGVLVLEDGDHARARGAPILAWLTGYGMSLDAHDMFLPSVDGIRRAIRKALVSARCPGERVGHVNANGTGTKASDAAEAEAIRAEFGDGPGAPVVTSTKSMHGHALGAAGAFETIATVEAVRADLVPPTINALGPDPDCPVDVAFDTARERPIEAALCNSLAFGGLNAVLVVEKAAA